VPAFTRPNFKDGLKVSGWTLADGGSFTNDVWRVQHDDGRAGVIKTARGKKSPWPERFAHEVNTLEKLQPLPGVLRLLEREDSPTPAWVVTELAETLVDHLGQTPDVGTVVSAFADIADSLVSAAELGIAHRDVKPDNLFYARGKFLVGDFGLATGHGHAGLTEPGSRVGPANFLAPEAREARDDLNWFAADVYAFAKSLWVSIAGRKYPPEGPLLIRRRECDLNGFGGPATDDLVRLLEIATQDSPGFRPKMPSVRDELRAWLRLHPPGTTPRPEPGHFRRGFAALRSPRAVDEGGLANVVEHAVQALLTACRKAGPDSGQIVADPSADVDPPNDLDPGGDPDWSPEHVVVKKLSWGGAGGIRLVAVGILDVEDDLTYQLSWQLRTPGTADWKVTWRAEGHVRMRLPRDAEERNRLADEAIRHRPAELDKPARGVTGETEDALRRVLKGISRRDAARDRELDSKRLVSASQSAQLRAREDFATFWGEFVSHVNATIEFEIDIRSDGHDNQWFFVLGDRRIVVKIDNAPTHVGPALMLGTVWVEVEYGDRPKSYVANVCALADTSGDPVWQLVRFERNDKASNPAHVSEALSDARGAVGIDALDELLGEPEPGDWYPAATLVSRDPLDVDSLLSVVVAELDALNDLTAPEPSQAE